jgi:hypothetical protein
VALIAFDSFVRAAVFRFFRASLIRHYYATILA